MSRKKRRQEEMEAQLREEARKRAESRNPGVIYAPMGGLNPVAPPSGIIQLPPIVQPVVMVPFSSQMQPLATYIDDDEDDEF